MTTDTLTERRRAIRRGLEFIDRVARDPAHFAEYGSDLLNCFYFIARTSRDAGLRRAALRMAREHARSWRREHESLPPDADQFIVLDYVQGSYAADRLGFRDPALKRQLREAARRFAPADFFDFDPRTEPPPSDVPGECESCGHLNARGRRRCRECRKGLTFASRYCVWYCALIVAYTAESCGVPLGATYADVLRWLPFMRPYRGGEGGANEDFYDTVYAVTHVVYTLNDYSRYRLSPRWLPDEFAFLKGALDEAMAAEDAEMVGEVLDSLKAFGLTDAHPLVRRGCEFLLSRQNADGSWGEADDGYIYGRYHPTWTAIDGLRDYAWRGTRLKFPELKSELLRWSRGGAKRSRA